MHTRDIKQNTSYGFSVWKQININTSIDTFLQHDIKLHINPTAITYITYFLQQSMVIVDNLSIKSLFGKSHIARKFGVYLFTIVQI